MEDGTQTIALADALESARYAASRFKKLKPEHKRFDNPHIYKVGISKELMELRDQLTKSLKA
jgi:nicotinate phosphoribosyltransferase